MKKVLKIFGAIILCLGVVALIVCMCAIPNETKLFFDRVFEYLDKPFVLCGVSVTIGGILLFVITRYIINSSSIGKKQINELQDKLNAYSKVAKEEREKAEHKLNDCEEIMANGFETISEKCDLLENALKQVPNKKVQEVLNNGEETKDN